MANATDSTLRCPTAIVANNKAKITPIVFVLTPPPVEPGEAPMNDIPARPAFLWDEVNIPMVREWPNTCGQIRAYIGYVENIHAELRISVDHWKRAAQDARMARDNNYVRIQQLEAEIARKDKVFADLAKSRGVD